MKTVQGNFSTKLQKVSFDSSIETARLLMESKRIRHLLVSDNEGYIVGVISDRDVALASNPEHPRQNSKTSVAEIMSWPVVTIDEESSLAEAAEGMIDEKLSAFLVTRKKDEIVGIITSTDLLRVLAKMLRAKDKDRLSNVIYSPLVREAMSELQMAGI